VGSAFNEPMSEGVVRDFVLQFRPAFPLGWNTRVAVYFLAQYSVLTQKPFYVPHLVFIDRHGVIQRQVPGEESTFMGNPGENIRKTLDQMLAPVPPASKAAPKK
jgi:hypothetical protein